MLWMCRHTGKTTKSCVLRSTATRIITNQGSQNIASEMTAHDLSIAAKNHKNKMNILLQHKLYRDKKHPVYNFLFTYVFINPKNLFRYSPGVDTVITGMSFTDRVPAYTTPLSPLTAPSPTKATIDSWQLTPSSDYYTTKQLTAFTNTLHMLRKIQSRAPLLNCFGLHEWAMLYQKLPEGGDAATELSQFQQLPLRVTPATIAAVVQTKSLRCTHFDAFRFFTADAVPLNSVSPPPSRAAVAQNDQPGCVHVTMDLFKWTIKIFPFCSSELLYDALQLAIAAREVDMRASPYDLTSYRPPPEPHSDLRSCDCDYSSQSNATHSVGLGGLGLGMSSEPIRVELPEGQKEYQKHQERLFRQAIGIRERLIQSYTQLLNHYSAVKS